jgi:hypothetical protein
MNEERCSNRIFQDSNITCTSGYLKPHNSSFFSEVKFIRGFYQLLLMQSSIFYDEERNLYIDLETGVEIPGGDHFEEVPDTSDDHALALKLAKESETLNEEKYDPVTEDHSLALSLAASEAIQHSVPRTRTRGSSVAINQQLAQEVLDGDGKIGH